MYIYIHIHTHTHTYIQYTHVHTYIHTYTAIEALFSSHLTSNIHTYIHIRMYAQTYITHIRTQWLDQPQRILAHFSRQRIPLLPVHPRHPAGASFPRRLMHDRGRRNRTVCFPRKTAKAAQTKEETPAKHESKRSGYVRERG